MRTETIRDGLKPIAEAICGYPSVLGSALWWRLGTDEGVVHGANPGTPTDSAPDAALAALARGLEFLEGPAHGDSPFVLSPAQVRALSSAAAHPIHPEISALARAGIIGTAHLRAIVLLRKPADEAAALAAVELGWRAAACALSAAEKEEAREFWRARAMKAAEESSRARAERAAAAKRYRAEIAAVQTELAEQRARAAKLGLRMFTAIDDERAKIARDLHDEQAQLIAAAQIALESGGGQGREIFRRASEELRRRIRGLKSAPLGDMDLDRALAAEFTMLTEAGITPKLMFGPGAKRLSRSAQQLCWHVAREALANVIRHANASRVEVTILRQSPGAVISITDNGDGITAKSRRGAGLDGLSDRLRLMGGKLALQSARGTTRLVAEIPEVA